jgi:hypothetical protein
MPTTSWLQTRTWLRVAYWSSLSSPPAWSANQRLRVGTISFLYLLLLCLCLISSYILIPQLLLSVLVVAVIGFSRNLGAACHGDLFHSKQETLSHQGNHFGTLDFLHVLSCSMHNVHETFNSRIYILFSREEFSESLWQNKKAPNKLRVHSLAVLEPSIYPCLVNLYHKW